MTRRITLILAALLFATPAFAVVNFAVVPTDSCKADITYTATAGEDIRAFALDITADTGNIIGVTNYFTGEGAGYGIFPGSFRDVIDAANPNWSDPNYSPVAPSGDPDAAGALGSSAITIELGSLYVGAPNQPADSGTLLTVEVDAECTLTLTGNASRGNVVLEDASEATTNLPAAGAVTCEQGPACWQFATQCNGDTDGDGDVDTVDWPAFRDGFGKTYPNAAYNPCADFDRDGDIDTVDWPKFRDNFAKTPAANCTPGGTWPPA
jgi:hypothetical protein